MKKPIPSQELIDYLERSLGLDKNYTPDMSQSTIMYLEGQKEILRILQNLHDAGASGEVL